MELLNDATNLLLSKGLEVRSPYIPYLQEVDMVKKQRFLAGWWGQQRPLTAAEITHLFSNIQTNHLGSTISTGFGQVAQLDELREYMKRGKEISKKQIENLRKYLDDNNLPVPNTWDSLVQVTNEPPFSDKLMMYQMSMMTAAGIGNYGTAISATQRHDIGTDYTRLLAEIGHFAQDSMNLQIKYEWLERPPHAADRDELMK